MTYNEVLNKLKEMLEDSMQCSCDNDYNCKKCSNYQESVKEALALQYAIIYMEQHLNNKSI